MICRHTRGWHTHGMCMACGSNTRSHDQSAPRTPFLCLFFEAEKERETETRGDRVGIIWKGSRGGGRGVDSTIFGINSK